MWLSKYFFTFHMSLLLLMTALISHAQGSSSAVIMQYHNVSTQTPRSTSVTPTEVSKHMAWLKENGFTILPLPTLIESLQNKTEFESNKVVAITFDDTNKSVCEIAWPILKKENIPFTLFINSDPIEKKYSSQCTWQQLNEMMQSGLLTAANHSHTHINMTTKPANISQLAWLNKMQQEITLAQTLIEKNIEGAVEQSTQLFAYPYGEYNTEIAKLVTKLGYIGFGQHSGAVGFQSDFSALPRFPISSQYANLETLKVKLLSLAFPGEFIIDAENPIEISSKHNPPILKIKVSDSKILNRTICYNSKGEKISSEIDGDTLIVQALEKLEKGRHRYTCTSPSAISGRYYWGSHQWLIE